MCVRRFLSLPIAAALLGILASTVGCGDANMGRVHGTVTLDGQPLDGAMVTFAPAEGGGRPAAGRTDNRGRYQLVFSRDARGAMVGPHTVSISTYSEVPGEDGNDQVIPERVPAQYNVNSDLTRNVERGSNEFNFDLQSDGEIITHIE